MLGSVFKGLALLASTVIAVPYTVALLCNVLYGWPQVRGKYRRAFHPKKVFALNYSVVQKLTLLRFFCLYWKWKYFYTNARRSELIKDVPYGRNYRTLDIYSSQLGVSSELKPVVIFVYGGAWGSGDKHVYCLLCSQLSHRLGAVVCCPNYSLYPQGYVDDMIQDVVDCISWTYENIESYGGDKDKIILIGHSAGAHLCAMSILELLHDERVHKSGKGRHLQFDDQHYDGVNSNHNQADSSASSDSFAVVGENGDGQNLEGSNSGSMFEILNGQNRSLSASTETNYFEKSVEDFGLNGGGDRLLEEQKSATVRPAVAKTIEVQEQGHKPGPEPDPEHGGQGGGQGDGEDQGQGGGEGEEEEDDTGDDDDSVVTVKPKDIERHPTLVDLCKSVKAFIGLAGVYKIEDHYIHESDRGIEDVSSMARAMYGEDHFDRFSPTVIIKNLARSISLPKIVLVHGTEDYIVPLTSTTKFADALSDILADVTVRIVPGCDHYELCLDLMDPDRKHFDSVMGIIMETANHVV
ncbi:probable isoprenylcysteine alpha-carbonyl methylesterase ICME [Gigantopelta aegis]|uniref:probable isoprenylcysteine alpha-carbonyl methylesterase ICME n=1 Tax=Gigantopelta aegis TaxID=1735272 RepID=UPI001B8879E5|nr:probable isoprenylcysteine alpha-carbonyl methylesterase ICME [Gigantopelta aegis]XP_041364552.1 probable isoprenylcysteine alpha-carbonyl methylesterase ICME [Gigantopelta aegis]